VSDRLCATGLSYSWGVFQQTLYEQGLSSTATLSFIGSITIAMVSPLALISARLIQNIGTRNAALLGSIIFGAGLLAASFATKSLPGLFITVGVLAGTGVALVFMVSRCPLQSSWSCTDQKISHSLPLLPRLHPSYHHSISYGNGAWRQAWYTREVGAVERCGRLPLKR
jgi:MFS family permease